MKNIFFVIFTAVLLPQLSFSQSDFASSKFEILEIEDAISSGDFLFAYERVQPLAKAGHPQAEFILGTMNQNGWGMPQNYPQALSWYSLAGSHGSADGAYNAGVLTLNGRGTLPSATEAMKFFEMAARLDHAPALHNLGVLYAGGHGIDADAVKSFEYYVKASQLGHPGSIYQVGRYFVAGHGTSQDFTKARQWFEAAATYHLPQAQYELALLHLDGRGGEENKIEAFKWLLLAQNTDNETYAEKVAEVATALSPSDQNTAREAALDWLAKFSKQNQ